MATPAELLSQSIAKLRAANRIDGTRASYRKDNPGEYVSVMAYLDGGPRPGNVTSDMGMGLMLEEDARRALGGEPEPPPPPPPPPPPSSTPWTNYRYEVSGQSTTLPNRHFAYQADGSLALTCYSDSPLLGSDRHLVSAYLPSGAQAAEGKRMRYETRITFPADFKGTTGEINWWMEWHTMTGAGSGQLSCAIGGRCDYPVDYTKPGNNLTWMFRPTGPGGKPPLSEMIGPPITVGRSYDLKVEALWSSTNGEFKIFLDGQQLRDFRLPTLWSGDNLMLGIYHYRIKVPFASTLNFTKPIVTAL